MKKQLFLFSINGKKLILLLTILCSSFFIRAQNPYLNGVNNQLRSIFSNLTFPDNDVLFLYERSAKMSDSTFYSDNSLDTANYKIWRQVYSEMYYSAHDTLPLQIINNIEINASQFSNDTINIGLMDYEYYDIKDDALTSGDYFIFDTINDLLFNHPNPIGNPYDQLNIFMAAPFKEFSSFSNPVFRIDPQFFFSDQINSPLYTNSSNFTPFRIDFGDGSGWHYFDVNSISTFEASYTAAGEHIITCQLLNSKMQILKSSKSAFSVASIAKSTPPDFYLGDVDGLDVGVYEGCQNDDTKKVVIYLEGFDILDMIPSQRRGVEQIYDEMISSQSIRNLRNFNYTFYVVSWENSRIDIRFNALYVVNLIEKLKSTYKFKDEQFVIIGESMGGLVGKYALSFMESQEYIKGDFSQFFQDQNAQGNIKYLLDNPGLYNIGDKNRDQSLVNLHHKTREFITLDTPHQGANIPLSIQHAYRRILGLLPGSKYITSRYNLGLESYAAREMLLYHMDGKSSPNSNASTYYPDPAHFSFYNQLNSMGYPQFCKNVALSSGSLLGENQKNVFGAERTAGDLLLGSSADVYMRILWKKVRLLSYHFVLNTNPNGSGLFYKANLGVYTTKIKLKWFGIKIKSTYQNIYSDNQMAINVKPYCVSAGGYLSTGINPANTTSSSYSLSDKWLFNLFSYNINATNGCLDLNSHVGWNGFASTNLDFSLCSDGSMFGFVPLQSALDYGNGLGIPLNHNIKAENINLKLSRTHFDVIIGYPITNHGHLNYRDENIYNTKGQAAANCSNTGNPYTYFEADLLNKCSIDRGLLCLEIGDEELYLENWKLNRKAKFQTQYALYVNKRNPYYEYPSTQSTLLNLDGVYSKENNFQITNQGFALFLTDKTTSPTNDGFVYINPAPNGLWYAVDDIHMPICLVEYKNNNSVSDEELGKSLPSTYSEEQSIKLYPNPNSGDLLIMELIDTSEDNVEIQIMSVTGEILSNISNNKVKEGKLTIDLKNLKSGIYMVSIKNDSFHKIKRLIIN